MKPAFRLFISTSHELTITGQACRTAPEGFRKRMALEHYQAAQAAFADNNETRCLEQCRAAVDALA